MRSAIVCWFQVGYCYFEQPTFGSLPFSSKERSGLLVLSRYFHPA